MPKIPLCDAWAYLCAAGRGKLFAPNTSRLSTVLSEFLGRTPVTLTMPLYHIFSVSRPSPPSGVVRQPHVQLIQRSRVQWHWAAGFCWVLNSILKDEVRHSITATQVGGIMECSLSASK